MVYPVEPRAFCIMSRLVIFSGEAKPKRRSRRETESEQGDQSLEIDAKRDDLSLTRMKSG